MWMMMAIGGNRKWSGKQGTIPGRCMTFSIQNKKKAKKPFPWRAPYAEPNSSRARQCQPQTGQPANQPVRLRAAEGVGKGFTSISHSIPKKRLNQRPITMAVLSSSRLMIMSSFVDHLMYQAGFLHHLGVQRSTSLKGFEKIQLCKGR